MKKYYRIVSAILLIAWMLFIFHNSMEDADLSSARSTGLLAMIQELLGQYEYLTEHLLRKLAHFTEFAIEGVLLVMVLRGYTERILRYAAWPLLMGLMTALSDETLQLFSEGRAAQVTDVWIDFSGAAAGILAAAVLIRVICHRKNSHF